MVQNCCVVNCNNRRSKGTPFSFHSFPGKDPERMKQWISRISRQTADGKPWQPTKFDKVCSAHFLPSDFCLGLDYKTLKSSAVPSVFSQYPVHKQVQCERKRPSPKKRKQLPSATVSSTEHPPEKVFVQEHSYCCPSITVDLERTKEKLTETQSKLTDKRKKIKILSKKVKRRDCKLASLLEKLRQRRLLHDEEVNLLKENFSTESFTLIENELQALGRPKNARVYSDDLKAFAVTLHFYSAAAYAFVRKHLHLPHANSIRPWASSHSVQPGFLTDVVHFLKSKCESEPDMKDVTIMFDSMSIRKEVVYDKKEQAYAGYVNHGYLQTAPADTLASEALVLLAVGLKKSFKHPIGYFLIDKISASQQAQIIRHGISLMSEAGFNVQAVVCDGAYANQATAQRLGCKVSDINSMDPTFNNPYNPEKKIYFVFDAAHLLKNVRNCLADLKIVKSGPEEEIKWQYIVELYKLQSENTLYLANKLRAKHIDFQRNKMKVSLAAQILSSSVANAIDYLREELKLPQFAGSEATTKFIRWFDALFDLCNSSNCLGKGLKSPLNKVNITSKTKTGDDAARYIKSLTDALGRPLVSGKRKTGFLGFLVTVHSVTAIAQKLLSTEDYRFFLTYRLSQDHLETFFSKIRRRGGWNNNPNTLQFKWALRALLQKNGVVASEKANCALLPEVNNTLFVGSSSDDAAPFPLNDETAPGKPANQTPTLSPQIINMLTNRGVYHDHVLHYIAGFITRKMTQRIRCSECSSFLSGSKQTTEAATFTQRVDRGGLVYASEDTLRVMTAADRSLRRLLVSAKEGPVASVSAVTTRLVTMEVLEACQSKTFAGLGAHCMEHHCVETEDNHVTQIIKEICELFCSVILTHLGRLYNERFVHKNRASQRHKLTKAILFLHL